MILMWPFCVVTLWIITDLHLAQTIAIASPGLRASASFLVLTSLRNCRSLGDAVMPSSPVGLYWACTGPASESRTMADSVAIRVLFVVCIFLLFFLFCSLLLLFAFVSSLFRQRIISLYPSIRLNPYAFSPWIAQSFAFFVLGRTKGSQQQRQKTAGVCQRRWTAGAA